MKGLFSLRLRSTPGKLSMSLAFGESMFGSTHLECLASAIRTGLPLSGGSVKVSRGRGSEVVVADLGNPSGFSDAVQAMALQRGEVFRQLVRSSRRPAPTHRFGMAEIQHEASGVEIFIRLNDFILRRIGTSWVWGNTIGVQLSEAAGPFAKWEPEQIIEMFTTMCRALDPLYALASDEEEYAAKNIDTTGGGMRAIGVDASRSLPGIYWLNYFGEPYAAMMGRDALLSSPAFRKARVGAGIMIQLSDQPGVWRTRSYRLSEKAVLEAIGRQFFFDRRNADAQTEVPSFVAALLS